jgi:integrase
VALTFARLTRPAIRSLAIGERIAEHGIIADRLKSGDVRYTVDMVCDGQRIHRVVGRESDGVTRTQAELFIEQTRTEARGGRLNLPMGRKVALLFGPAADDYIRRLRASDGKNIARKESHLVLHLKPHFGTVRLSKISEFAVKGYRKVRKDAKAADATINRELATLSHLLRSAARWGWIKRDDLPAIDKASEGQGRIIVLNDAQCRSLMTAAIADHDTDIWLFVAIGLGTGMRHDEIVSIRWPEIDFPRRRIFVPLAKAGSREQPIPAELAATLEAEREQAADPDGWVFPAKNKNSSTGHRGYMDEPFRRAAAAAGLDSAKVTPHVMRHTAVTRLVRAGADIPTIMKISGHKTVAMVLRYTHVDAAHIDAAAASLGMTIPGTVHPKFTTPQAASKNEAA